MVKNIGVMAKIFRVFEFTLFEFACVDVGKEIL